MNLFFILAQILAVIAFILTTISMQFKKKSNLLMMQILSNAIYTLEYLFLGAWTASISFVIGTIRNITYYLYDKKELKPNILVLLFFVILIIVSGIYTWEGLRSLLPTGALVLWTIVSWQDNTKWMRVSEGLVCIFWIIYDLFVGAYTGILTEVIILVSIIIGMIRNDIKKEN